MNPRRPDIESPGCACGDDNVHLEADQVGHQRGEPVILAFRPSIFDDDVLVFDVAEMAHSLTKGLDKIGLEEGRRIPEVTDPVNFTCVLRLAGERDCEQHRDKNE